MREGCGTGTSGKHRIRKKGIDNISNDGKEQVEAGKKKGRKKGRTIDRKTERKKER